jgi:uncharacterized protein YjbI with pentapeptide repeats
MAEFAGDDLSGSHFERVDLTGAEFRSVGLSHARLRGVDMTGVAMRGVELVDARIDGEIHGLVNRSWSGQAGPPIVGDIPDPALRCRDAT